MILSVVIFIFLVNETCSRNIWHYNYQRDKCGVEKWHTIYEGCDTTKHPNQSPINIISEKAKEVQVSDDQYGIWKFDEIEENAPNKPAESLKNLPCRYNCITRHPNSKTFVINKFRKHDDKPGAFQVTDPKGRKFYLDHIWLHYGSNSTRGSDHQIDGKAYPLEMQFVFTAINFLQFENANNARNYSVMAIGVFAEVGDEDNPFFKPLLYKPIQNKIPYDYVITWDVLLPNFTQSGYFFYKGSESHPGCHEDWDWFIFEKPLHYISENQLEELRQFNESSTDCDNHGDEGIPVSSADNFRPVVPLNNREVLYYKYKVKEAPSGVSVDDKSWKLVILMALALMNYA